MAELSTPMAMIEDTSDRTFAVRPNESPSGLTLTPLRTREVRRFTGGRAVFGCATVSDRIGQRFDALQVNAGGDAWVEVYKHDPAGNEVAGWRVDPDPEPPTGANKGDNVCACICRSPTGQVFVRVGIISHFTAESTGRPYIWGIADIMDAGAVFDPTNPAHADNVQPIAVAAAGEGATVAQIAALFTGSEADLDVRGAVENKIKDANSEEFTDTDTRGGTYRTGFREQVMRGMGDAVDRSKYAPGPNHNPWAKRYQDGHFDLETNIVFGVFMRHGLVARENPNDPQSPWTFKAAMFAILDEWWESKGTLIEGELLSTEDLEPTSEAENE